MDDVVFKAILAMDSYNRGYNAGIEVGSGSAVIGTPIGGAFIERSVLDTDTAAVGASFYAIAYDWNGQKVISHRGTDNLSSLLGFSTDDLWNGYGVGRGSVFGVQAELAIGFYKAVIGPGADPRTANVTFTGHSLGGGLTGLVASGRRCNW